MLPRLRFLHFPMRNGGSIRTAFYFCDGSFQKNQRVETRTGFQISTRTPFSFLLSIFSSLAAAWRRSRRRAVLKIGACLLDSIQHVQMVALAQLVRA